MDVSTSAPDEGLLHRRGLLARDWIGGFLLVGVLTGLTGSILIAWHYHIDTNPRLIGLHFLAFNAGYLLANVSVQRLRKISNRTMAMLACLAGACSLAAIAFLAPPLNVGWRILALGCVGASAGALMPALFHALEPSYLKAPAQAVNLAGVLFGSGCFLSTVTIAATYSVGAAGAACLAAVPIIFLLIYARSHYLAGSGCLQANERKHNDGLADLRNIAAVLFSLLLFFQFGNEWSIAGWLPLFLIHRLGCNPQLAIFALALYFAALMIGRLTAGRFLSLIGRGKLLLVSTALAMAGYLWLSFTASLIGALGAIVVIGAGFASIYPVVAAKLGDRFYYQPGFYNGIFSIAMTGAMSAPWLLGYVDALIGMRYVMLLPALGSVTVFILTLLLMLEARLTGGDKIEQTPIAPKAA